MDEGESTTWRAGTRRSSAKTSKDTKRVIGGAAVTCQSQATDSILSDSYMFTVEYGAVA